MAANRNDTRRFHTSQAIPRTYMGFSPETGPSGYGKRLAAVPQVTVGLVFDAGNTDPQVIGDLPAGFILSGDFMNFKALTGGTVELALAARGVDYPEVVILTAGDLINVADRQAMDGSDLLPLPVDRTVVATVIGGTDGEVALCAITGYLLDNGWF